MENYWFLKVKSIKFYSHIPLQCACCCWWARWPQAWGCRPSPRTQRCRPGPRSSRRPRRGSRWSPRRGALRQINTWISIADPMLFRYKWPWMAPYLSLEQCNIHKHRAGQHNKQNVWSLSQNNKYFKTSIQWRSYNELLLWNYPRDWRQLKVF